MKKFAKALGISVLAASLLAACGDAEVEKVENNNGSEPKQEETAKEEAPQNQTYKIGDTVSIEGMEITLVSANFAEPAEYSEPANGKVLEIEVIAKNNGSDNNFVDNTEFTISDEEGNMLDQYYGFDYMFSGEVKKGKQMKGKVAFDVTDSESYEIFYEPSFSFKENTEVQFDITKEELQ